jgi:predicted sulfurtransferase
MSITPPTKTRKDIMHCNTCGLDFDPGDFSRDRSKADGYKPLCKSCDRAKAKRYYEDNRADQLAKANARNARLRREAGAV